MGAAHSLALLSFLDGYGKLVTLTHLAKSAFSDQLTLQVVVGDPR